LKFSSKPFELSSWNCFLFLIALNSPGRRTATNQEPVQPHFCALDAGGENDHFMGLYFRSGSRSIFLSRSAMDQTAMRIPYFWSTTESILKWNDFDPKLGYQRDGEFTLILSPFGKPTRTLAARAFVWPASLFLGNPVIHSHPDKSSPLWNGALPFR
jgi:hypothetical protein